MRRANLYEQAAAAPELGLIRQCGAVRRQSNIDGWRTFSTSITLNIDSLAYLPSHEQKEKMSPSLALIYRSTFCEEKNLDTSAATFLDRACGATRAKAPPQTADMEFPRTTCSSFSFLSSSASSLT